MSAPTPQQRFELAKKNAALLKALLSHPGISFKGDGTKGIPDRANIHPTLYNVTDFQMSTFTRYILPLLPPGASENSRDLSWQPNVPITDNPDLLADNLYSRMNGGLKEKYTDALGRDIMLASIILERSKQMLFGGTFDFGSDVEDAARALTAR